ncbi:MAG TPA: HAD-IA family hydrolase [Thermoanaerobaculia bacterium]|nr:HAD-IA family hydrolase [Thermoanaerobaculia bacterium]
MTGPAIRAVFFDAGQTLLDADPPVEAVYRDAFAAWGVTAEAGDVHLAVHETWRDVAVLRARGEESWTIGGGEASFWRRFVAEVFSRVGGGELPDAMLAGLVRHFRQACHWRVYAEVPAVLEALRAGGLKLLVVSNWDSSLPPLLSELGLAPFFDDVVVSALVGKSKPSRGIFEEALGRAGVAAGEALHVGDSLHDDYDGARAAGLAALLVDRHGRAPAGVEAVASLEEILPRVLPGRGAEDRPSR